MRLIHVAIWYDTEREARLCAPFKEEAVVCGAAWDTWEEAANELANSGCKGTVTSFYVKRP